jgi:glyceraldehyde-3-phosphate dehydrogenase (NADP+)
MEMYVAGRWKSTPDVLSIRSPYSGEEVDTVPAADSNSIEECLAAGVEGAKTMADLPAYERSAILNRAADLLAERAGDLARTISLEVGKPLAEANGEVSRMPDLLRLCAFEGTQIRGETLPIDAQAGAKGKIGLTLRRPCGLVVAISPFNYPLLLVVHKIGPALAAGNAVILKPATQTPLVALKLTQIFLEAGLPENGLQCITGYGSQVGGPLCADPRVRKISFTGSTQVGETITRIAGVKKLSLELGSNSPVIVLPDADIEQVAEAAAVGGFVNAGQVCISTQRVIAHKKVYGDLLDALKPKIESIQVGDPLVEGTKLASMISEHEAIRVETWVEEARNAGAHVLTGGQRSGAVYAPTLVADVDPELKISRQELFGPALAVTPIESIEEAIAICNRSDYGLGAGIFTQDLKAAWTFARKAEVGNVMINWTPLWRADLQPYGGFKMSGIGKEGPRYAVEEMTETKTVVFHGLD